MQQIRVFKVTANIGIGEVGEDVQHAANLLEKLTGNQPVKTQSGANAKGFGLRDGLDIGAKVTLRGDDAEEFLARMFDSIEDNISIDNFDSTGNFAFGVEEYINVPGIDYDPDIGMQGFDVAVTLERPGYRIKRRQHRPKKIGKDHRITPEEAANFVQERFDVEIEGI
jgi:large subunit ribosomal protein L5